MRRALILFFLFIGALISSYFALEAFATAKIKEKLDRRLSKTPYAVSYSEIKYNLASNDLLLRDLTVRGSLFSIYLGEIFIDLPATFRRKGFPPELRFYVKNGLFSLDVPFVDLVLDSKIGFDLVGGYSFFGNSLIGYLNSNLKNLGVFQLKIELINLNYSLLGKLFEGRTTYKALLNRGKLGYLSITVKNKGIFEKFLQYAAHEEGVSENQVKEEIKAMIRNNLKNEEISSRIGEPLENFIDNPTCLRVEIKPKTPIGLNEIKSIIFEKPDLVQLINSWGIKITDCS